MKLGIKIVFTSGGVQDGPTYNNNECLVKYATDVRPYLRKAFPTREQLREKGLNPISSFDESSKIVYLVQFLGNEGYLLTIIKASPEQTGRTFDNTAVWIHVPLYADISNSEMIQILDEINDVISDPYNLDESRIQEIAKRNYQTNTAIIWPMTSSAGQEIGVFRYGRDANYDLKEILGASIRQPSFKKFRAVFLVDNSLGIALHSNDIYINERIRKIITINNPNKSNPFVPYIGNVLFDRPIELTQGEPLSIVWKRNGFKNIDKPVDTRTSITDSNIYAPKEEDWVYFMTKDMFVIVDKRGKRITDSQITIDKKVLGKSLEVPYVLLINGFTIKVKTKGYDTYTKFIDNFKKGMEIKLDDTSYNYLFELPIYDKDGNELKDPANVSLKTSTPLVASPIKGYEVEKHDRIVPREYGTNQLYYKETSIVSKIKYFCIGAGVVALIWIIASFFSKYEVVLGWPLVKEKVATTKDSDKNNDTQTADQKGNNAQDGTDIRENKDSIEAIKYLEQGDKGVWRKSEMEKNPYLRGLFDDLNYFRFSNLKEKWASKLKGSKRFKNIMDQVEINIKHNWDQVGKKSITFNTPDDEIIIDRSYENWIKTEHKEIPNPPDQSAINGTSGSTGHSNGNSHNTTPRNNNNNPNKSGNKRGEVKE